MVCCLRLCVHILQATATTPVQDPAIRQVRGWMLAEFRQQAFTEGGHAL
jgi:hypothetical protein